MSDHRCVSLTDKTPFQRENVREEIRKIRDFGNHRQALSNVRSSLERSLIHEIMHLDLLVIEIVAIRSVRDLGQHLSILLKIR
jgi:hypothetical protein